MNLQKLVIALFFVFVFFSVSAQYNTMKEWYIGPIGGATMSTITLTPKYVDKAYSFRKTMGISTRYISEKHFGFQIDLNYYESGWKEDVSGSGQTSYIRNLNFIEVPFLMHAYTAAGLTRFFINLGPNFSYLLSENENLIDQSSTNSFLEHGKLVEHPFQYGLMGGIGFEVHVKRNVLGIEGRYCYTLSDLYDNAIGDDFTTSSIQTISLNLYYYFQIQK